LKFIQFWFEPTPQGEFRIWIKLRATRMTGGSGKYAYDLPNLPYTMFFENENVPSWRGYGLHGAYWHNQFGTPRSHGCVNLPVESAKQLYYWVSPELPDGKSSVKATEENQGTRVVIHE
jgi:lipoprotein-anchoring transpeptidase ErfK/SrfK